MADPFRHHPELRDLIRPPDQSQLRQLDMAELDRIVAEHGGPSDWRHSDAFRDTQRAAALEGRRDGDLWIFAYGSLIWDPGFHFAEVRSARVDGYARRFCLRTDLGRGTPECPGMMAALDRGGECLGLAFRIDRDRVEAETAILWRREFLLPAYLPVFVSASTAQGPVEALTCVIDPSSEHYEPDTPEEVIAHRLATGSGFLGTALEYAERLAENLAAIGLQDPELDRLRDRARDLHAEC